MRDVDFDEKLLYMHNDNNGIHCYYNGEAVPPWVPKKGQAIGCRYVWSIMDKWFVKANHNQEWSQTHNEVKKRKMIEPQDERYFVKLLGHADMQKDFIHWSVWEYINLAPFYCNTRADDALYDYCYRIVNALTRKYHICDVSGFVNGNWFIHNGKPLIVDLGCD